MPGDPRVGHRADPLPGLPVGSDLQFSKSRRLVLERFAVIFGVSCSGCMASEKPRAILGPC